jgi:hypothetical protein
MVDCDIVSPQLTQHCTEVQMGVRFEAGFLQTVFKLQGFLEELQGGAGVTQSGELHLLLVVAGHVVESDCQTAGVVFTQ